MPTGQHVVFLKEKESERYLPIWIGADVANAIASKITNTKVERPMTHDLMASSLRELGVTMRQIVVTSLSDDIFYARLYLAWGADGSGGREIDVDARPSDAIALAVRFDCPLFVASDVFERAGIVPSKEEREGAEEGEPEEIDEDRLAVFRNMINNLNLPDLPDEPGAQGRSNS